MQLSELYRKLIAAARANQPDARVPYAFEKRVMARLSGMKPLDGWALWGQALSRSAIFCVALLALVAVAAHYYLPARNSTPSLTQDVEMTLLAAVDNQADSSIGEMP
jgi:hypothetical protein